jgi:hypothetical protein
MLDRRMLRWGAVAAVVGALAQITATVLEPQRSSNPYKAVRTVADSSIWQTERFLDLIGVMFTVGTLAVIARTFTEPRSRQCAGVGSPFFILMGGLGCAAVLVGSSLKNTADAWADAQPAAKQSYVAAFDSASMVTDALFFGAFLALGIYLVTLSCAFLTDNAYSRRFGWAAASSGTLVIAGDLLLLLADAAFILLLLGFLVFLGLLVALGVALWRQSNLSP